VTAAALDGLLTARASVARVHLTPEISSRLQEYFSLLAHWNRTINLTSLPLEPPTEQAIDRLLIEPLTAIPLLAPQSSVWFDIGSGGGSPAIPLQIAHPAGRLVMVESRERKAAFLRQAVRELELPGAEVMCARIESLVESDAYSAVADLVTIRAVRLSASTFSQLDQLLKIGGQAVLFGTAPQTLTPPRGLDIKVVEPPLVVLRRSQ
jgi:16S rRNA (guanine(527)-N(7))-methyltransferase RsmG